MSRSTLRSDFPVTWFVLGQSELFDTVSEEYLQSRFEKSIIAHFADLIGFLVVCYLQVHPDFIGRQNIFTKQSTIQEWTRAESLSLMLNFWRLPVGVKNQIDDDVLGHVLGHMLGHFLNSTITIHRPDCMH